VLRDHCVHNRPESLGLFFDRATTGGIGQIDAATYVAGNLESSCKDFG
jgi:hypothetical protein